MLPRGKGSNVVEDDKPNAMEPPGEFVYSPSSTAPSSAFSTHSSTFLSSSASLFLLPLVSFSLSSSPPAPFNLTSRISPIYRSDVPAHGTRVPSFITSKSALGANISRDTVPSVLGSFLVPPVPDPPSPASVPVFSFPTLAPHAAQSTFPNSTLPLQGGLVSS